MGFVEFVTLTAAMQSIMALSIDAMLSVLSDIGKDLNTAHPNEVQYIVFIILVGFGLGRCSMGLFQKVQDANSPFIAV